MSLPASPLVLSGGSPRLSPRRRGSIAAPDPFGTVLVQGNDRSVSSTLTITRAPPKIQIQDFNSRRRRSTGYGGKPISGGSPRGRISFAFSAFSPNSNDSHSGPLTLPSTGDTSPSMLLLKPGTRRSNSFTAPESSLTPMQVYEVAQQCNNPHSQPPSPDGNVSVPSTPVSYTPLPDAVYLPFLDRPREVEALMATPPTSTLFALLAQTFPTSSDPPHDSNPATWTYAKLKLWLTKVDRSEAEDLEWVQKSGACISARSELMWERVKDALGVPPDLDMSRADNPGVSGPDDGSSESDVENSEDCLEDAWVEPIVSSSSPRQLSRSPTFGRSSSLGRQSVNRMEDISEDVPGPDLVPPPSPSTVHGLRIITSPAGPPGKLEYSPAQTSARSFSHRPIPYDVIAEREPGNPLFPSSFANLALGPTLSANNPALRCRTAPPLSAYCFPHSMEGPRRRASSWADNWDVKTQEYAVSLASSGGKKFE